MSDGTTPPLSAKEQFIESFTLKCEYTGVTIPECCCYDCMRHMLESNLPSIRSEAGS